MFSGRDIGVDLPILLKSLVAELPLDGSTMLRIGMTNPPYILEHLNEIAEVLRHPCVYSFLHVPVQSGSDAILTVSNRHCFTLPKLNPLVEHKPVRYASIIYQLHFKFLLFIFKYGSIH